MKKNLLVLFLLMVSWREALFLVSMHSDYVFPYDPSFPYVEQVLLNSETPKWLYSWANFDGTHYLTITSVGYWGIGLVQAFFPLFPLFLGYFSLLFGLKPLVGGVTISFISFTIFLFIWFSEMNKKYDEKFAWKNVAVLLLFPTSFFFAAIYSESFFLVWFMLTWYFARKKNWIGVAISILFASSSRLIGILLIPAVLINLWVEQYAQLPHRFFISFKPLVKSFSLFIQKDWKKIIIISLGSFGLLGYMFFLQMRYQDPLAFFHVQDEFGAGRETKFITLPQVFWRAVKILHTVERDDWKYFAYAQETAVSFLFLSLWGIGAVKRHQYKISWGELFFSGGAYLLPTLTGTFSSMPRYVLVCIPLFVVLTHLLQRRIFFYGWLLFSSILLLLNTILFLQGYWVA